MDFLVKSMCTNRPADDLCTYMNDFTRNYCLFIKSFICSK